MILGVLQARVSSSRLPGKVLRPILGKPMLTLQIERLRRSMKMDRLLVATSTEASDDPLVLACAEYRVECFRGSLEDVLDRFCKAAQPYAPEHVVRLTGDCPLADPEIIDQVIAPWLRQGLMRRWHPSVNMLPLTFTRIPFCSSLGSSARITIFLDLGGQLTSWRISKRSAPYMKRCIRGKQISRPRIFCVGCNRTPVGATTTWLLNATPAIKNHSFRTSLFNAAETAYFQ